MTVSELKEIDKWKNTPLEDKKYDVYLRMVEFKINSGDYNEAFLSSLTDETKQELIERGNIKNDEILYYISQPNFDNSNKVERYKQIFKAIHSQLEKLESYVIPPIIRSKDAFLYEEDNLYYSSPGEIKETDVKESAIMHLVKDACCLTKDPDLTITTITNYLEYCFEKIPCSEERKDKIWNAVEEGYNLANQKTHNERILNFDYNAIDLNEKGYIKVSAETSDVGKYIYASPIAGTDYKAVLVTSFNLTDNKPSLDLIILDSNNEPVLSEEYDTVKDFNRRDIKPIDLRRELDVIAKVKVNELESSLELE